MARRAIWCLAVAAFVWLAQPAHAADPLSMAGNSKSAAKERATLLAALAAAKDDLEARAVEERLWTFWRGFADAQSKQLLAAAERAQLDFDYGHALEALYEMVKHQPDFAEGWNRLAYALFLANSYDAALAALDEAITREPMHYAALAGKGIILTLQGRETDGQAPLKRALAINPWLKERNLIGKNAVPVP
jgi:tetratricopeptide (TPR) repeat protein